jgi:hypothetical protein
MIGNRPANHAEPQPRTRMTALSSFFMNRLLSCTTIALLVGLVPALAAENATPASPGAQQGSNTGASSALPTQPGATPETSKSATMPPSGGADQSGGATERSSNPPASGAAKMKSSEAQQPSSGSEDTSGGAMERSSAPPGSSAAEPSKPNPTLNSNEQQGQTQKPGQ